MLCLMYRRWHGHPSKFTELSITVNDAMVVAGLYGSPNAMATNCGMDF